MTYTSPEFVVSMRRRVGPTLVFLLVILYGGWFSVVLLGEQQAWSDDPQHWAVLSTDVWAWGGVVVFAFAVLYYLLLLVRREVPAKVYVLGGPAAEGAPASFLQSGGKDGAPAGTVTAEADRPPQT